MLSLVAGGIGLSFVVESAKRTKPRGVVLRDVEDLRVTAQLFAIWRKDNHAPALRTFLEMIRGCVAGHSNARSKPRQTRIGDYPYARHPAT
jgi:DNA-binding transcriptional LysR family regulator